MVKAPSKARKKGKAGRADEALVANGLADSLDEARALIMAGQALVDDQRLEKPSDPVRHGQSLRLKERGSKFVSRGGDKLAAAIVDLGLEDSLKGATVLDVGASTGGFTHCCLEHGAARVIALDVGSNQLAWELRSDPRVTVLEKTDIRDVEPKSLPRLDLVVADVSFNSLSRLAPALRRAAPQKGARFLLLVKPQFELRRSDVPEGGIVQDEELRQAALQKVDQAFLALGLSGGKSVDARVAGRKGNREIFYYVSASSDAATEV